MKTNISSWSKDAAFARGISYECDELLRKLNPVALDRFWRGIGAMVHIPTGSTVLQRRRGYREVYRHFIKSRLSARVPIVAEQMLDFLEAKDIAKMYELWSYFIVMRELEAILGKPSKFERLKSDRMQIWVGEGFEVAWAKGTRLFYNLEYSRFRSGDRFAYSVPLRPDIALEVPTGPNAGLHLFDAKFRLEGWDKVFSESDSENIDDDDADERRSTFKKADLHKMHTYRDSIIRARSVWVLYPGNVSKFFPSAKGDTDELPKELDGLDSPETIR